MQSKKSFFIIVIAILSLYIGGLRADACGVDSPRQVSYDFVVTKKYVDKKTGRTDFFGVDKKLGGVYFTTHELVFDEAKDIKVGNKVRAYFQVLNLGGQDVEEIVWVQKLK